MVGYLAGSYFNEINTSTLMDKGLPEGVECVFLIMLICENLSDVSVEKLQTDSFDVGVQRIERASLREI